MESIELSSFHRSVCNWPETVGEISAVCEKVSRLLPVSFVALSVLEPSEKFSIRISSGGSTQVSEDLIREFIERQIKIPAQASGQIRSVHISRESAPWAGGIGAHHLSVVSIIAEERGELTTKGKRKMREFGWLAIGTSKALTSKEEILSLAAAQRVSELAEVYDLEMKLNVRSQFLSIASHELKTPLTSIYGMLQLQERMLKLKKDEPIEIQQERQNSFLKIVIKQVQRLNELIDGLLDVSRIQNGRFMVEPSDTDVLGMVRELTSARLAIIAQEAGVRLQVDVPEHLVAWVDPVRMEEVVTNLIMNAIRFSPEGGVVWIRLREDGESFRLTVRDQGPHVPIEDRERIFQPFERAQRTGRLGGLGLGLFISRQIAQLHGGNVNLVESVPGKGNVFEATFPVRSVSRLSA